MSELDEKALAVAVADAHNTYHNPSEPDWHCLPEWSRTSKIERVRIIVKAYLAAAARPEPDAEAMEREEQAFRIELDRFARCAEKASIWYPTDEYHTKRTLERDNKRQELIEMFRKAATR